MNEGNSWGWENKQWKIVCRTLLNILAWQWKFNILTYIHICILFNSHLCLKLTFNPSSRNYRVIVLFGNVTEYCAYNLHIPTALFLQLWEMHVIRANIALIAQFHYVSPSITLPLIKITLPFIRRNGCCANSRVNRLSEHYYEVLRFFEKLILLPSSFSERPFITLSR